MSTSEDHSAAKSVGPLEGEPKYRAFISYSHENYDLASKLAEALDNTDGVEALWDEQFAHGQGFHEQIKNHIAHAHVFVPILTEQASQRIWVHQEIGFSMALNIPVLPIAVGELPEGLIQLKHALRLVDGDVNSIRGYLSSERIAALIERSSGRSEAIYACAEFAEDRARLMAQYAEDVMALGKHGIVRQRGGLSSFAIPTQTIGHSIWKRRYGNFTKSDDHCRNQRKERLALGRHAEARGCKLIIESDITYEKFGVDARLCRLECLLGFLQSMNNENCQVAIHLDQSHSESVTLVGNWFCAEAIAGSLQAGFRQTVFTRHAPTVMEKLYDFDAKFDELLDGHIRKQESRDYAIAHIEDLIKSLKS
ncbi:MAG: toll/interleukin-1 receptor domain-containing protein [Fimbriimonas sp.]|nr:toll/interleukin-1 receptor domain-containing protein [Fimbriimonas sp.]